MNKKAEKYSRGNIKSKYHFTSKIICGICGKKYKHKNRKGRVSWSCSTCLKYGKGSCLSKEVHEDILILLTNNILGLKDFDESVFEENIKEIQVPKHNILVFVLRDDTEIKKEWSHKSLSESWGEEAREKARERSIKDLDRKNSLCIQQEQ